MVNDDLIIKNVSESGFDLYPNSTISSDYDITLNTLLSDGNKLSDIKRISVEIKLPINDSDELIDSLNNPFNIKDSFTDYANYIVIPSYYTVCDFTISSLNDINIDRIEISEYNVNNGKIINNTVGLSVINKENNEFSLAISDNIQWHDKNEELRVFYFRIKLYYGNFNAYLIPTVFCLVMPINLNKNNIIYGIAGNPLILITENTITETYKFNYTNSNGLVKFPSELFNFSTLTVTTNKPDKVTITNISKNGFNATFSISENEESYKVLFNISGSIKGVNLNYTYPVTVKKYHGIIINTQSVGDILCSDGSYITPTLNWETGECTNIDLSGKTPIGIVVVPGTHTPDGTARIMSLLECDLDNPSTPTTTHNKIKFGDAYRSDIPELPPYLYTGLKTIQSTYIDFGFLGTKWNISYFDTLSPITKLYYISSIQYYGHKMILPNYYDQSSENIIGVLSDFEGKENTESILTYATGDENWRTGSITNSSESGYFPVACACYRYITPGTQEGDWYLPALGELSHTIYYLKLFQSILSKLNTLNSGSAVEMNSGTYWSSSKYNGMAFYRIKFDRGYLNMDFTINDNYLRPFLSVPYFPMVGDIYCSDGTLVTPTINWETGECISCDLLIGKTPIGIVVVPGLHTPDKRARIVSLLECDPDNPSVPTYSYRSEVENINGISWGGYGVDTALTNYDDSLQLLDGTTKRSGYLGTKWSFNSTVSVLEPTNGLYYGKQNAIQRSKIVSPFLSNGGLDISKLTGAMSDFNGKENTATLISLATSDPTWRTGSIVNSDQPGYYPAACCCYRYITPGTQEGDWYLPALGELIYIGFYRKLIDSVSDIIKDQKGAKSVSTFSTSYASSTEKDSNYFWGFTASNLMIGTLPKGGEPGYINGRRIRPFMKI